MTTTESEAEKKLCPFSHIGNCCASKCMAWRWIDPYIRYELLDRGTDDSKHKATMVATKVGDRLGYCGLVK